MSKNLLHMAGPTRKDSMSKIVGDIAALTNLRDAIDDALNTGSGGTQVFMSDGEPYLIAVVRENDMDPVYTTYANEVSPQRSKRETIDMEEVGNYLMASHKARENRIQ